ncbi:hypothetical protein SAY87_001788 [Trapa incisa]|uniref:PRLI-interacting factor A n=1 Tax=Trapa incisa TaxID=236973 RepID=A0AAN7JT60_9MYRT|nr:hypothetical protein SAY87_001788 [Trapa incisa]
MSRFEIVYPNYGVDYSNNLENRVDDQDTHIAQLEEENLTLKERLFLMERELGDMRRRLQFLEGQNLLGKDVNEEVVENASDNETDGGSDVRGLEVESKEDVMECLDANAGSSGGVSAGGIAEDSNDGVDGQNEGGKVDACMVGFTENETRLGEPISEDNEAGNEILHREEGEGREILRNEEADDLLSKAESNE